MVFILQHRFVFLFIIFLSLATGAISYSESPILITNGFKFQTIAPQSAILINSSMSFEDVKAAYFQFVPYKQNSFQFGFSNKSVWVRFSLQIRSDVINKPSLVLSLDNPTLGNIKLYIPVIEESNPYYIEAKEGWQNILTRIETLHLSSAVQLPENWDASRPFYLKVETPYAESFSAVIYSLADFQKDENKLTFVLAFCLGILAAMIIFNLVLFINIRERRYFLYVIYAFCQLVYTASLVGVFRIIYPEIADSMIGNTVLFFELMKITALIFITQFLKTKKRVVKHHYVLLAFLAEGVLELFLYLAGLNYLSNLMGYITGFFIISLVFSSGIICYRKGFKPAIYFTVAWAFYSLGFIIFAFQGLGILSSNFLTMNSILIFSAVESIILSFALVYQFCTGQESHDQLKENEMKLTEQTVTDELTRLYNRRYFNLCLPAEIEKASKTGQHLTLLMLDVDNFKKYNDSYGQPEGDKVLTVLGSVIRESTRSSDTACRYGGEEFAVILTGTSVEMSLAIAERIRIRFSEKVFILEDGQILRSTVSIGLAHYSGAKDAKTFIRAADFALYEAKEKGRNQVVRADEARKKASKN